MRCNNVRERIPVKVEILVSKRTAAESAKGGSRGAPVDVETDGALLEGETEGVLVEGEANGVPVEGQTDGAPLPFWPDKYLALRRCDGRYLALRSSDLGVDM